MDKPKFTPIVFEKCEHCDTWPALWRWYNGKHECSACSRKSFKKYLLALPVLAVLAVLLFII